MYKWGSENWYSINVHIWVSDEKPGSSYCGMLYLYFWRGCWGSWSLLGVKGLNLEPYRNSLEEQYESSLAKRQTELEESRTSERKLQRELERRCGQMTSLQQELAESRQQLRLAFGNLDALSEECSRRIEQEAEIKVGKIRTSHKILLFLPLLQGNNVAWISAALQLLPRLLVTPGMPPPQFLLLPSPGTSAKRKRGARAFPSPSLNRGGATGDETVYIKQFPEGIMGWIRLG